MWGETALILPTSSPRHRVGLFAGICWTKSQSPRYSLESGGRPVVTNEDCITMINPVWGWG